MKKMFLKIHFLINMKAQLLCIVGPGVDDKPAAKEVDC